MHRIFLALAVTDGTLLLASFALGFASTGAPRGPGSWYTAHFLLGLLSALATLLVHSIAFTYFLGTGRWVKEVAYVYKLPDWVYAQAAKNKRRAFPFELSGMLLIGAAVWLGAGTERLGWPRLWHTGMSALALGFNFGAFAVEYAAIVAQARLLLEVKDQADRIREAATRPPVADPPAAPA
jgi:hypothetical protein